MLKNKETKKQKNASVASYGIKLKLLRMAIQGPLQSGLDLPLQLPKCIFLNNVKQLGEKTSCIQYCIRNTNM